jgi:hypothetical protein
VIENDEVGTGRFASRSDLGDLAAAREERGVVPSAAPGDRIDELGACRQRQRFQLGQPLGRIAVAEVELDKQRPVALGRTFNQASRSLSCGIVMARAGTTVEMACL